MVGRSAFWASVLVLTACGREGAPSISGASSGDPTLPGSPAGTSSSDTPSSGSDPLPEDGGTSGVVPSAKKVRFIAVGDTGTGSNAQTKVGNAIAAVCKQRGCDFVQLLGDNLYDSGASSADDPIWETHFEIPYAAIDLDFFAVLGNHDYGHGGAGTDFGKAENEIKYTQKSKKWKLPSAYYRHVPLAGGPKVLEIFALDTNMILFERDSDQRKDMTEWLKESKAEWKIAVGHHPYKSNGPHGNAGKYNAVYGVSLPPINGSNVKSFMEDVVCGKADLYLSGHDHSRQWLNESCKGTDLAVSGAGAKATELGGDNPALFESLELGFLYIVIEGKTLTAEFVDENGKTEFTHVLEKP